MADAEHSKFLAAALVVALAAFAVAGERAPVMGGHTTFVLGRDADDFVEELSGLCLSAGRDFLWGVGDNGDFYRINFDGTYERLWNNGLDMEGLAMDPASGVLYVAVEPNHVFALPPPYAECGRAFDVAGAADMGNSGIEGIAWRDGLLVLGAQSGAVVWLYSPSGEKCAKKTRLRKIAPTISEVAGLCHEADADRMWALDSNDNAGRPEYEPFTLYLFDGAMTRLISRYGLGDFANWNPEAVCVDRGRGCVWIAEDCGDGKPSLLHRIDFDGL
ncbi:MAG: hypothetical protein IJP66_07460 [Kiritimatiellae bacterium]|nr:hypothetical protein [Kiritimatiellia bacterium]